MPSVHILPLQFDDHVSLYHLAEQIQQILGWPVQIETANFDYSYSWDQSRQQFHSSQILLGLRKQMPDHGDRILAVATFDLFIPILTFVYGEAQLNGPAAVVSTHRLRPEYYGLPADPILVAQRLVKESIHELGHTFGLRHCLNIGCVLNASTYVEEIDLKTERFCPDCWSEIQKELTANTES